MPRTTSAVAAILALTFTLACTRAAHAQVAPSPARAALQLERAAIVAQHRHVIDVYWTSLGLFVGAAVLGVGGGALAISSFHLNFSSSHDTSDDAGLGLGMVMFFVGAGCLVGSLVELAIAVTRDVGWRLERNRVDRQLEQPRFAPSIAPSQGGVVIGLTATL